MTELVVASFNIRNGLALDGWNSWPLRRRVTAGAIRRLNADVVGLQEVFAFQQRYLERRLRDFDAHGVGRDARRAGERCPVLIRRAKFDVLAARTRWYGDVEDEPGVMLPGANFPRIATSVRLRDRSARTELEVLNTHLDERHAENRARSVEQLLTWVTPDRPTIVIGDLNATEADAMFESFVAAGFRSALPSDGAATVHGFTGRTEGRRIDHIFVSGHWDVGEGWVASAGPARPPYPSDHWPVVAALRFNPPSPS